MRRVFRDCSGSFSGRNQAVALPPSRRKRCLLYGEDDSSKPGLRVLQPSGNSDQVLEEEDWFEPEEPFGRSDWVVAELSGNSHQVDDSSKSCAAGDEYDLPVKLSVEDPDVSLLEPGLEEEDWFEPEVHAEEPLGRSDRVVAELSGNSHQVDDPSKTHAAGEEDGLPVKLEDPDVSLSGGVSKAPSTQFNLSSTHAGGQVLEEALAPRKPTLSIDHAMSREEHTPTVKVSSFADLSERPPTEFDEYGLPFKLSVEGPDVSFSDGLSKEPTTEFNLPQPAHAGAPSTQFNLSSPNADRQVRSVLDPPMVPPYSDSGSQVVSSSSGSDSQVVPSSSDSTTEFNLPQPHAGAPSTQFNLSLPHAASDANVTRPDFPFSSKCDVEGSSRPHPKRKVQSVVPTETQAGFMIPMATGCSHRGSVVPTETQSGLLMARGPSLRGFVVPPAGSDPTKIRKGKRGRPDNEEIPSHGELRKNSNDINVPVVSNSTAPGDSEYFRHPLKYTWGIQNKNLFFMAVGLLVLVMIHPSMKTPNDADTIWKMSLNLSYGFAYLTLCLLRMWESTATLMLAISYGPLVAWAVNSYSGPLVGRAAVHLTTAWAAGCLGYSVAIYKLSVGSLQVDTVAQNEWFTGQSKAEKEMVHNDCCLMVMFVTMLLSCPLIWIITNITWMEGDDILLALTALTIITTVLLYTWSLPLVYKGAIVSLDTMIRLLGFFLASFAPSFVVLIISRVLMLYYFSILMMMMAVMFGYVLAQHRKFVECLALLEVKADNGEAPRRS